MALNKNKEILIPSAIIGILSLGLIFLVIFPLKNEIKKNSEEFNQIKNNLALLETKTEDIEEIKQDYQNFQTRIEQVNKLFIDFDAPLEFINFLENNAEDTGLSIEISSLSSKKIKEDPWPSLTFQMKLKGPSSNFLSYIQKLENAPYLIEITRLYIRKLEQQEGVEKGIEANVSIKVFARQKI